MNILKELPPGAIWPHLLVAIDQSAVAEIEEYAKSRLANVARGAETPELAALLVDKYGSGMARALAIAGIDSGIQAATDRLVREIDPEFNAHCRARWAARPAQLGV